MVPSSGCTTNNVTKSSGKPVQRSRVTIFVKSPVRSMLRRLMSLTCKAVLSELEYIMSTEMLCQKLASFQHKFLRHWKLSPQMLAFALRVLNQL
ncbi:hypothetical protein DPMN_026523 [Dreissena polymorpha]|uniref:Uncharacterized protein n=1 Tax=Dreissena polymorpha TaxID=45954 RepID=A0A9D4RCT6_DREPO|nr:hypothetical protein DPMN_026523 [Dreissena polymorpha]